MSTMKLPVRTLPGSALDARSRPLRSAAPARCTFLPVRANMSPSQPGTSGTPARPVVTAHAQSGTPQNRPQSGVPPGGPVIGGPGAGVGGPGPVIGGPGTGVGGPGIGSGGAGQRPVSRGGGGGGGGAGGPPPLPGGWSWDRVLLTLLGIALAVPAWKYVNRRYILKPEPEHTIAKVEDKAAELKGKVAVQHKAEDVKDSVDIGLHDAANKAERTASKAKKETKHAVDHAVEKVDEIKGKADSKAHEASVKGGRAVQRGKEKASDAVYEAEAATGKTTKSVLENIKGAAHTVGRKLHVVADSTEKGMKKGADAAEKATGTKTTALPTTDNKDRTKVYAIAAGAAIGTGVLAAALYYWDRKGGDLKGKVKKLQDRTKEAADKALHRTQAAHEPAKPPPPSL